MANTHGIKQPQVLHIVGPYGVTHGANHLWYADQWHRRAGCGPTSASHLIWYLRNTRPSLTVLCPYDASEREGFIRLMDEVWEYVTPGMKGLNKPSMMTQGLTAFATERGVALKTRLLEVPSNRSRRPSPQQLADFLVAAFDADLPVAFLNLSKGALHNLDSWHWVTLVDVDADSLMATMYDAGRSSRIDLNLWLHSSTIGGGFVVAEQA